MITRINTSDPDLQRVLSVLVNGGHQALIVGGAVRNALIGAPPSDWDISTDALPSETTALAEAAGLKAIPTGADHGTITVVVNGRPFEVTTFRRDVETDGRRAVVAFSKDIRDDAQRRDFTMNALYAAPDGTVIDPVGGMADLAARHLRFVGEPRQRIAEDYLRILRFFRFLAWYGEAAHVDAAALAASSELAAGLQKISRERIGAEMRKLLSAPDPGPAVALMAETGVLAQVLPDAEATHLAALIAAEGSTAPSWARRLALLSQNAADALRLSKSEAGYQSKLAEAASWSLPEAAWRLSETAATDLALIRQARSEPVPADWRAEITRAAQARFPLTAGDLLSRLNGPALGQALKSAEQAWIDSHFTLNKAALIEIALRSVEQGDKHHG